MSLKCSKQMYSDLFDTFDINRDNSISLKEIHKILLKIHIEISEKILVEILTLVNGNKDLNKAQFFHFMYVCENVDETKSKLLFLLADKDQNGVLDQQEFISVMKMLGYEGSLVQDAWKGLSNDGKIEYGKFSNFCSGFMN